MKLISQLIKDISRVLQKLLRYFNGIIIILNFSVPSLPVFPIVFCLSLNETVSLLAAAKLAITTASVKAG